MNGQMNSTEFKKLLIDFLKLIRTSKEIWSGNSAIADSSTSLYSILKAADDDSWSLYFDPPWIVPITKDDYFEDNSAYLVIGGEIKVDHGDVKKFNFYFSIIRSSHSSMEFKKKILCLSCCERDFKDKSRIVRRFHFDTGEGIPEILKAKSHLQFGGICHEHQAIKEFEGVDLHYCLDNKMKIPRFPFPPIDIIILLDILLRQFETSIDRSFVEKSEWRRLVRKSEDFRLCRYYFRIHDYFLQKRTRDRRSLKTLLEYLCDKDCVY